MTTGDQKDQRRGAPALELGDFAAGLAQGVRIMGLDVGSKTVGLALSDATRSIASGLVTLRRTRLTDDLRELLELAVRHGVGGFVVGLPLNLDGSSGPRVQATRAFVRSLAKATPLPVVYWDERLSTVAAERALLEADLSRKRRAEVVDKVAATLILQGALDRMRHFSSRP
jgi:putative Holliday junction resolvase